MKFIKIGKRGQEEIVGFALIIIVVAVVLLFLLSFALRGSDKENIESYEVDSFIQASLQYTTDCEIGSKSFSVQGLIFECADSEVCDDERPSCEVLSSSLSTLVEKSWNIDPESPVKGYEMLISNNEDILVNLKQGNQTRNYKGSLQSLARGNDYIEISLKVYS